MAEDNRAMAQRLRELRQRTGLAQGEVARRLDISPAYLSLIEKGKRAVQLPLLFRAIDLYGVSIDEFMRSLGETRVDDGLARLLDEPLLRSLNLTEGDVQSLSSEPRMAATVTALFNLYKNTRSQLDNLLTTVSQTSRDESGNTGSLRFDYTPFDEVTDFLEQNRNWFESLEARAELFRADSSLMGNPSGADLTRALEEQLGVRVRTIPGLRARGGSEADAAAISDPEDEAADAVVWRWNASERVLQMSAELFEQRARFQLAHTIALVLFDEEKLHKPILAGLQGQHAETRKLIKIHLANYFAGALLLPYGAFFAQVNRTRYDVELLSRYFASSYEMVAHRMCNLSQPDKLGVPLHFLRVDVAGNISKRYSGDGIRLSTHDGSCPKLAVHQAFLTPNVVARQYSEFPDGTSYFCFAKVVSEPQHGSLARGTAYSIGLGVHAQDAKFLAYANDLPFADPKRMAVPVGTTCRFCERANCNMRSAPSYKYAFRVDESIKKDNFFSPLVQRDP